MFKRLLSFIVMLLPMVVTAAPVEKNKDLTLMLEWFINPDHAPIIVAQQKGYFEQEGLNVTIQEPADPNLPPKLVAAGNADIAVYYQHSLSYAVDSGASPGLGWHSGGDPSGWPDCSGRRQNQKP